MSALRATRARLLGALLPVLVASSCSDDPLTQLVVVVDSDWDGLSRLEVEVEGFEAAASTSADLEESTLPRRFAIVHDGGPPGPIDVTVSAFVDDEDEPVLVEPRERIFFERDKTMMLKIELRFRCVGKCEEGEACVGESGRCVPAEDAAELVPWDGSPDSLEVKFRVGEGDRVAFTEDDAGMATPVAVVADGGPDDDVPVGDGDGDSPTDGGTGMPMTDAEPPPPPVVVEGGFDYTASNFDPEADAVKEVQREAVVIDCAATFDSTDLTFSDWCGPEPTALVVTQSDDSEAALLVMDTLEVRGAGTLRLVGSRPVIVAVFGGAAIHGHVDASAAGAASGPGAGSGCSMPEPGESQGGSSDAGGGGGGGGFGSAGGRGGAANSRAGGAGGVPSGEPTLVPLRGGCPGAAGGDGSSAGTSPAGGGGGGVQISAAGRLEVNGRVTAVGGGGGVGPDAQDGGGGGGSGGGILLEGAPVDVDSAAVLGAGGGGGGGGQPHSGSSSTVGGSGSQSSASAASGGNGDDTGGDGGSGAAGGGGAGNGSNGSQQVFFGSPYGGGGGGGGGVGRIRVNGLNVCPPRGIYSPWPTVGCDGCGVCAQLPASDCTPIDAGTRLYFLCATATPWPDAWDACAAVGYPMATVSSQEENDAIAAQISAPVFLGGSDNDDEDEWIWPDGTHFWSEDAGSGAGYSSWSDGEPNSASVTEDCLTTSPAGTWNDEDCDAELAFVCEVPPAQ